MDEKSGEGDDLRRKSSFGVTINIAVKMAIGIEWKNLRTRDTYKYLSVEIKLIFYQGISLWTGWEWKARELSVARFAFVVTMMHG